jgi:hypothetical protein
MTKNPEIDPSTPDHGTPGDEITMPGRFFGTKKGKVYIEYEKDGQRAACPIKLWTMEPATGTSEVRFRIPQIKYSGPCVLIIANKVGALEKPFTIG